MTGLEPLRHVIIEIATLITDDNLNVIAEGPDLVIHASPEQMAEMGDFVTEMHTKSGLIDAVATSTVTTEEAETQTLAFLKDEPPVIVDWLPWNHTFGGNHNIGLTLYNGGSMYLDEGKPMPGGIEETVRNLREISPTVYFNVPKGYESLLPYLRADSHLRKKFFARLHAMFFSGAALSPYVWSALDALAVQETGARVPMLTGLGATETAPTAANSPIFVQKKAFAM